MKSHIFDIVQAMSGQDNSISIPRPYLEFFKNDRQSYQLAAVLNQLVFWSGKSTALNNGWFYKTDDEIGREVGLSSDQIYRLVEKLKECLPGVIQTKSQKIENGNKVKHYLLNGSALVAFIFPNINNEIDNNSRSREFATPVPRVRDMGSASSRLPSREFAEPIPYTDPNIQINTIGHEVVDKSKSVLEHLNKKTGSNFREGKTTTGHICARLRDGATEEDLKLVIDFKVSEWLNDYKMNQYLRCKTLFTDENYKSYLRAAKQWELAGRPVDQASIKIDVVARDEAFSRLMCGGIPKNEIERIAQRKAQSAGLGRKSEFQARSVWSAIWNEACKTASSGGAV